MYPWPYSSVVRAPGIDLGGLGFNSLSGHITFNRISTLAQSWSIPPSPAQIHSCFTPASFCPSITPVHDPRSSSGPTPDHPTAFLTFLQPYSSRPALVHYLWTWTQLTHLVSTKSTFDLYLFLIRSSLPLLPIPVSDPSTLSPSLGLFSCPCSIFLPSPDPLFPLSLFIGVYLSLYILTFIPSIYKAPYSV